MLRAFPEAGVAGEQQTRSRAADELRRGLGPGAPPAGLERSQEGRGLPGGTRGVLRRGSEQLLRTDSSRRRKSRLTSGGGGGYGTGAEGSRRVAPQVRPHPHAHGQTDRRTDGRTDGLRIYFDAEPMAARGSSARG